MNDDDIHAIRSMKWRHGVTAEQALAITTLWNDGRSIKHIAAILAPVTFDQVKRTLATARARKIVEIRKVVLPGAARSAAEHASWWTPDREKLAKTLWEAGEMKNGAIAKRLDTSDLTISERAARGDWVKTTVYAAKDRLKGTTLSNVDHKLANIAAATKQILSPALPGSAPNPFYLHQRGTCKWPLDDPGPGEMDRVMVCCAPADEGATYCPAHLRLGINPSAWGKPKRASELARSLRRYA